MACPYLLEFPSALSREHRGVERQSLSASQAADRRVDWWHSHSWLCLHRQECLCHLGYCKACSHHFFI